MTGIFQGLAFAIPLWWVSRSLRWHHALAIIMGGFLAGTYGFTVPRWAINLMAQPVITLLTSTNLLNVSSSSLSGFTSVPVIQTLLAGCAIGLVLQRASLSFRWKHALLLAAGWALSDIVLEPLLEAATQSLFQDSSLHGSQLYLRRLLIQRIVASGLLYLVLAGTQWESRTDASNRPPLGTELFALGRANVLTNHLTRNRFGLTLAALVGLLLTAIFASRYFLARPPTPEIIFPSIALVVLPSLLVSAITANLALAHTRDNTWDLLVLTNLSDRDLAYALVQAGLYNARWLLVILIAMTTILSFGVMRVFTGLFYSLSPLTLPLPLMWKASRISLPFFLTGTVWLGAALGMRLALHFRALWAVLLAPLLMLAITLAAMMLAQNYQQGPISIFSEAVIFSTAPWLAMFEMMRSE
jgi:hypothetical protein